ncbi:LTA synthase family protein [Pseudoalteromonas sp. JBTF-M23]|uniref:LTA synthase family protein n=2 Tax=Pseudoalteromonas caenipelagi TaxID=2726988 RepID=A0A849VK37_9GAMM|nr:LTA synthase family protein [Pseudoalteromonas caenipelagi]
MTFLTLLALFTISRLALSVWLIERITQDSLFELLWGGFRVDVSTSAYLLLPVLLLVFFGYFLPTRWQYFVNKLCQSYIVLLITSVVLFEIATPAFINQYDVRPNRLFIEYLQYPHEVFSMLVNGHLFTLVVAVVLCGATAFVTSQYIAHHKATSSNVGWVTHSLLSLCCLIALALMARGTLGHRPLNPSLVYFSQDALVNSLTLNSPYSVAFAIKNMRSEASAQALYGALDKQKIIQLVRNEAYKSAFISDEFPTLSREPSFYQGQQKNLVIVLEESLGARFVGALGGSGLTPNFDQLYQQGWGFKNMYATGTRSVRGIEAVITGFMPSPSRSVVKLSKSQHQFYTLASALSQQGYTTQFIYGGESHFDNMKSFFLGNGFSDIVDINDIESPEFVASWGVSDEDLFNQADKELVALAQSNQPFFSLIFTSSNHDPFDIPKGKVSLEDDFKSDNRARDLAIKYADHALGNFITTAQKRDYWQNTIFLVVADHDVRVFGSEPVPIKSFHIPAVILNSEVNAHADERLVSQIDLPVTLLSLLGVQEPSPMIGYDLTKTYPTQRAMMQYYDNYAYIENDKVAVLMPGKKASYWHYDVKNKQQHAIMPSTELEQIKEKALAHVLFSSLAYQKQLYRSNVNHRQVVKVH